MNPVELAELIPEVHQAGDRRRWHQSPITANRLSDLWRLMIPVSLICGEVANPAHLMPEDLLPGAKSVVSFFLPFAPEVPIANGKDRHQVAEEWAVAYVETNQLIGRITARLIEQLAEHDIRAAAEPATGNFDRETLVSWWSHKSIAVLAGIGSFGLHHLLITDAGCAGRFGSLVLDAELPINKPEKKETLRILSGSNLYGVCVQLPSQCS